MSIQSGLGFKEWIAVISESSDKFEVLLSWYDSELKKMATAILNHNTQLGNNFVKSSQDLAIIQEFKDKGIDALSDKFDETKGKLAVELGIKNIITRINKIINEDLPQSTDLNELLNKTKLANNAQNLKQSLFAKVLAYGGKSASKQDIQAAQQLGGEKVQSLDATGGDGGQGRAAAVASKDGDVLSAIITRDENAAKQKLMDTLGPIFVEKSKVCFDHLYKQTQSKLKGFDINNVFKKPEEAAKYRDYSYAFYFSEYIKDMIQTQPDLYKQIIWTLLQVKPALRGVEDESLQAKKEKQEKGARFGKHQVGIGGVKKAFEVQRASTERRAREEIISKFEEYCYDEVVTDDNLLKAISARCLFGLVKGKTCMTPVQAVCMLPSDFRDEINEKMKLGVDVANLDCSAKNDSASIVAAANLQQKKVGMLGKVPSMEKIKTPEGTLKAKAVVTCDQILAITGNTDDEKKHSLAEKFFRPDFPSKDFIQKVITNLFDTWIFGTILSSLKTGSRVQSCADAPESWEKAYTLGRRYDVQTHAVSESTGFDNIEIFYIVREFVRTLGNDIS
jgi:hypothetical protein